MVPGTPLNHRLRSVSRHRSNEGRSFLVDASENMTAALVVCALDPFIYPFRSAARWCGPSGSETRRMSVGFKGGTRSFRQRRRLIRQAWSLHLPNISCNAAVHGERADCVGNACWLPVSEPRRDRSVDVPAEQLTEEFSVWRGLASDLPKRKKGPPMFLLAVE